MSASSSSAASLLLRQYRELTDPKKGIPSFHIELEDDNIFLWNIGVMVLNDESIYHGGYFKGQMKFPADFPFSPPTFRFTPSIYHPNVYKDGRLCISILHQAGDATTGESDAETWSPAQTVETVLISIVSLLEDPNPESPANVDAAVDLRKRSEEYERKVKAEVERSKQDIPPGFELLSAQKNAYLSNQASAVEEEIVDENFWYDSEEDDDDEESYDDDSIMDDIDANNAEDEEDEEEISSESEK